MLPISVLITARNEAQNIARCVGALTAFSEVILIDSDSMDDTIKIARDALPSIKIIPYEWDGTYPKKRQWVLENIEIENDFIFFVDADEVLTAECLAEIKNLTFEAAGYFVKGQYIYNHKPLKYGLQNNKLCLFNRHKIHFPPVDDLEFEGMGEIEGHYQPVLKPAYRGEKIEQVSAPLLHYAYDVDWLARHRRYARWEAQMIKHSAYPLEPRPSRQAIKMIFRQLPCRGMIAFCHSYFFKLGFLDGLRGFKFACSRAQYYKMVAQELRGL